MIKCAWWGRYSERQLLHSPGSVRMSTTASLPYRKFTGFTSSLLRYRKAATGWIGQMKRRTIFRRRIRNSFHRIRHVLRRATDSGTRQCAYLKEATGSDPGGAGDVYLPGCNPFHWAAASSSLHPLLTFGARWLKSKGTLSPFYGSPNLVTHQHNRCLLF